MDRLNFPRGPMGPQGPRRAKAYLIHWMQFSLWVLGFWGLSLWGLCTSDATAGVPSIQFQLSADVPEPTRPGRWLVALAPGKEAPRFTDVGPPGRPLFGQDSPKEGLRKDAVYPLQANAISFPSSLVWDQLPEGEYSAQAIWMGSQDLCLPLAPGNLRSAVVRFRKSDLRDGAPLKLVLNEVIPGGLPTGKTGLIYHEVPSQKLSKFHGRPMVYRVAVVLPTRYEDEPNQRYPLVIHIGGFGQRWTSARGLPRDPRFLQIQLDGAGPWGDPYQVNSANQGPYGDALVEEVIPFIETTYRGNGIRFTTGGSTGGWVAVALQIFYPQVFQGCWGQCPDGLDFRAFQLTNLDQDKNMYVNRYGFERPARRTLAGDVVYTVRHEVQLERTLGRGDRWEQSGQQWGSWNAVYGPRGADGRPKPLWDGVSGQIDSSVRPHWEQYDLRLQLERRWPRDGAHLTGKIRIWVGDADDYFLNNGVVYFREAAQKLTQPEFGGRIEIEPRRGHTSGWSREKVLSEMAEVSKQRRP